MNTLPLGSDFFPVFPLIGVGVADSVETDAFEDSTVISPMQGPIAHVMVGGIVDNTSPAFTPQPGVHIDEHRTVRHFEGFHEPQTGIEPAFSCLQDRCSGQRELLRHGVQSRPMFRAAELDFGLNTRTSTKS